MKYSFLVAAYNVEKYIKECLDSILSQNKALDYEVVVVNDGSTDKTLEILEKYPGIKLISKANEGLSPTRNTLIENSSGEWIIFVDSDDYISPRYLEELDKYISNEFNFYSIKERKDKIAEKKDNKMQKFKIDDGIASKVLHRSLFEGYKFPKEKFAIEDWDFFVHKYNEFKVCDLTSKEDVWYYYRFNENSLSKSNCVYRSRLIHAIHIYNNPLTREVALSSGLYGHSYHHLYMMALLWFPDQLDHVKQIKYKSKTRFVVKLQYWVVRLGIFNFFIRKLSKVINE